MLVILWLEMTASIVMYFVLIQLVHPARAQENPTSGNGLLVTAVGMVVGLAVVSYARVRLLAGALSHGRGWDRGQ